MDLCCSCNLNCCLGCGKSIRKELWRLRMNWLFLFILGSLYAISYTSISSSFHQFITNPRADELNYTDIEPGLGESESFYSGVITLFNIGALIGAIVCGILVNYIPYWHLILTSLMAHTVGYVIYAVTYTRWLIMVSKVFSGFFIGAEMALALSYFAESSIEYERLLQDSGKKTSIVSLKTTLFALHNIGVSIGYIFGPGLAVIFAQFHIDQFRSIAWYNVAVGISFMVLQVFMFHGESTCRKIKSDCCSHFLKLKFDAGCGILEIFLISFLIILRGVLSFRFGVYETIYNPVLSDYFGFNERDSSYFFLGLVFAQIAGTILLIVLQRIALSNQVITIIGLLMTIASCLLIADWQALPYDQCTEYSPFHNPDTLLNVTSSADNFSSVSWIPSKQMAYHSRKKDSVPGDFLIHLYINPSFELFLSSNQKVNIPLQKSIKLSCHVSEECRANSGQTLAPLVLRFIINENGHLERDESDTSMLSKDEHEFLACGTKHPVCIQLHKNLLPKEQLSASLDLVQTQSFLFLKPVDYNTAMLNCINANVTSHDCYWNPHSIITRKHCKDCQPLCRSRSHSLIFPQFVIGSALLVASIPVAWVPVAALVSNRVSKGSQGIVMGTVVALTAIGRSVSPIWLDAAYEGMQKRTFLAMILLVFTHLPFLVGIIFFYQQLKYVRVPDGYSTINETQADESDTD